MKPLLTGVLALWAAIGVAPPATAQEFGLINEGEFGPYLTNVTQDGVTVSWRTHTRSDSVVSFGEADGERSQVEDGKPVLLHHVRLEGLPPAATIHYRVSSHDADGAVVFESEEQPFRLAPLGPTSFRLVFLAEVHQSPRAADFSEEIAAFDPWFQIQPGDFVDEGNDLEQWENFFTQGDWYGRLPLFAVLGNHEYSTNPGDGSAPSIFGSLGEYALELLANPGAERYYAVTYGGVLLLGLSSNGLRLMIEGAEGEAILAAQLAWLEATLAEATDGVDDPGLIIAFFHTPPWASNVWNPLRPLERTWVQDNLVTRLEAGGVKLVLVGHDKFYERSEASGITYIQVSTSAGPREADMPDVNPHAVVTNDEVLSIATIEITDGCRAEIVALDPEGNVLDETSITGDCDAVEDAGVSPDPESLTEPPMDDAGCGCRITTTAGGAAPVALGWLSALAVLLRVRRRCKKLCTHKKGCE